MKDRIRELVGQAKCMAEETINRQISANAELDAFAEKFAELIVAECAKTVEVYVHESLFNGLYERGYNDGRNASASLIKQHFGVEK